MPSTRSPRHTTPVSNADDSERVQLARVVLHTALAVPGVLEGDPGPQSTHVTRTRDGQPLRGVLCAATVDGGYEVSLRLIVALVPLLPLAKRIEEKVHRAAETTESARLLRRLSVHFADLQHESLE